MDLPLLWDVLHELYRSFGIVGRGAQLHPKIAGLFVRAVRNRQVPDADVDTPVAVVGPVVAVGTEVDP